ncbi:hypothetical protein H4R21_001651 [Coemansia helicoidea]|uniref:Uncharacterized protein n=1 Tax=Coemansia helicoidea TaxID=1286919 RepID=A0ACC1LAE6_9FUNG|nr:hypothetical protein H4R21_001651 [Coemansia helicoidea]
MCLSLVVSLRHREGQAIFGRLVEEGQATPAMYGMMLRELVQVQSLDRAFALFDDMCARGVRPTEVAVVMLAQAVAQIKDGPEYSTRLQAITAYLRSWRITPGASFFVGLLKGYGWSGQHDMFDGLAARLRAHTPQSSVEIDHAIMANASKRDNADLTVVMAELVARVPANTEAVVYALCDVGRPDVIPTLVDLASLPENNRTANLRLYLALNDPDVALDPRRLQSLVLGMLSRGFTPTFRMSRAVISAIWLHGGSELAIAAYERLVPAGMPKTVGVLLRALQLYARSPTPGRGLDVFDELRERWAAADYAVVSLPSNAIGKLTALAIATRGIDAAQEMFDFLASRKTWLQRLPFTPLAEYYINHDMRDRAQALIVRAVQQGFAVGEHGANLCGRYLAETAGLTELANFLRHLQRTRELGLVANDVLVKYFALCAANYKKADFEWALVALAELDQDMKTWRAIIAQLEASNWRLLSAMVHVLIGFDSELMAPVLLHASRHLPRRIIIVNMVLEELNARGIRPTTTTCDLALSAMVMAWHAQRRRSGHISARGITPAYLTRSVSRVIDVAVGVGVRPRLLTMALLILASEKRYAHTRCLDILSTLPPAQRSVQFYGAIARGCERIGSLKGINETLLAMEADGIEPTAELLDVVAECYASLRPPVPPTLPPDSLAAAEDYDADHDPDDAEAEYFYKKCLYRALSIWREFEVHGLSPSARTCGAILTAFSRARKGPQGEGFVDHLLQQGIAHSADTALGWIKLRLATDDVRGARQVFGAIGDASRCRLLAAGDERYRGLDAVSLVPEHFAVFILHHAKLDELAHAVQFMDDMHERGLRAQPRLYAALLRALAHNNRKSAFVHVMKQMLAAGARPDSTVMDVVREYASFGEQPGPDSHAARPEPGSDGDGADDGSAGPDPF